MSTQRLSSTIERVTVFRSGAVVERRAALAPGPAREIAVGPLPLALADASARVALVSPAPCDLVATDVTVALVVPSLGEAMVAPAEVELQDARREVARLQARVVRVDKDLANLGALRLSLTEPRPRRPPRPAPLAAWRELDHWRRARRRALVEERVELDRALVAARERVQALDQREREARATSDASRDVVTKEIRLTLRGTGAVPPGASLVVTYVTAGAIWTPTYVLRVARDGRSASLAVRAHVAQASGEPWERVALTLSTAELRRETDLPELASLRIGRRQPARPSGWRPPVGGGDALFAALDQALVALPSPRALAARPAELDALVEEAESQPEARATAKKKSARPPPRPAEPMPESRRRAEAPPPIEEPVRLAAPAPAAMPAATFAAAPPPPQARPQPKAMERARRQADLAPARGGAMAADVDAELALDEGDALLADTIGAPPPTRPAHGLLRYGALAMRRWDEPERGKVMPASGALDPRVVEAWQAAARVASLPLPPGTWAVATSAGAFDHVYRAEGPVDVPADGRLHNVALLVREAPIQSTLVVVPREGTEAVRVATLQNPLRVPLLAGPVDVYWGDELLVTAPLRTTPPGGEVRVGLGVEERVKVARNVHYEEETKGLLSSTAHLRHEVRIEIGSRLPAPTRVEVRERVPLRDEAEREDIDVAVTRVEPPWEDWDQTELAPAPLRGGKRWRFELAPGEDKKLTYAYVIKIGGKLELVGGNRRE